MSPLKFFNFTKEEICQILIYGTPFQEQYKAYLAQENNPSQQYQTYMEIFRSMCHEKEFWLAAKCLELKTHAMFCYTYLVSLLLDYLNDDYHQMVAVIHTFDSIRVRFYTNSCLLGVMIGEIGVEKPIVKSVSHKISVLGDL